MSDSNNNKMSYSPKLQTALKKAEALAESMLAKEVEQIHFMQALIMYNNKVCRCLFYMGINQSHMAARIKQEIALCQKAIFKNKGGKVRQGMSLSYAIQQAAEEKQTNSGQLETIHVFISMVRYPDKGMRAIIEEYGITESRIREAILDMQSQQVSSKSKAESSPVPDKKDGTGKEAQKSMENGVREDGKSYCYDMVQQAREVRQDPVIGRDNEIRHMIMILSRKKKNNPCLVGDPGVGKTAVVEGLAQRIAKGDVPASLINKKLLSVDLGAMIAGAKYRGEFEERLQKLLNEVREDNGNTLLFIDELHNIVGAGASDAGTMDASNMLKPMLARGELHCIGATTLDEYRKFIEKDPALERRFQLLDVKEPSTEEAISILRGLKERFELFHGITIMDDALVSAVNLSVRYIPDRFLPDKAIDLIDESCAMVKNELETMPAELDKIERKIMLLEMEEAAIKKEYLAEDYFRSGKKEKLENLGFELISLRESLFEKKKRWKAEKDSIKRISMLRVKMELLNGYVEEAQKSGDVETASALAYGELPKLRKELLAEEELLKKNEVMVRDRVTEEEIAQTISRWTGIPLTKLNETDRDRTLHLGDDLRLKVIGQEEAVTKVVKSIIRSRAGVKDPNRPIGSFLFLGPTGVGKTELAKTLAESLFDTSTSFIRLDMTEYMEKHSVSKLIGAPPGYLGFDTGGQLTEAIRRNPYSVILFDEVEKAHPDIMNILLQIFDDGRLTDSQGKVVDCKNTILILTSNLGAQHIINGIDNDGNIGDLVKERVEEEIRKFFRPELLNRIDEKIVFKPLTKDDNKKIADLILEDLNKRMKEKKIHLSLSSKALYVVVEEGYDPAFGARPLKRYFQENIETLIAIALLENRLLPGEVVIDYIEGEYRVIQRSIY